MQLLLEQNREDLLLRIIIMPEVLEEARRNDVETEKNRTSLILVLCLLILFV